jgi:RNA polymerase sigma-70 factor, ECF subfamily
MVEATQDTDEALMEAFRDGDARAFERLVAKHQRGVYNFLLRSVRDGARTEELLQEVFLRVVRSKQRYERTAKFTTWLYSIARNLCVDESRRARFRNHASLDAERRGKDGDGGQTLLSTLAADEVPTDEAALAGSLRERLAAAVDRLPEEQREVFLLRQLAGLSFREIGETVGIPENTVKSRMRYALEKLRGDLGDLRPASSDAPARGKEAHV